MSDDGLEFGELRESRPAVRRRPDLDRHFCVVEVGTVGEDDLPIFVELDAWRDLIEHSREDVTVELGGVLLGGAYVDEEERPFVLVTDGLRAEHYEATRGSFKFTHDTWESITRRRDEFGGETRMTGWYHTHPDWGVFLSSMDLFICDHFFAKPLDLALVLDPCRADWGWFQWTGRAGTPPRRTGGFFLVAARGRQEELAAAALTFSGKEDATMPAESRWSTVRNGAAPSSAPVVHVHQPPQGVAQQAPLLFVLLLQTLLVAVLGWRAFAPAPEKSEEGEGRAGPRRSTAAERALAREEARAELMNQVLEELAAAPGGAFTQLTELQERNDELTSSLRAQQARERELAAQQAKELQQAERARRELAAQVAALTEERQKVRDALTTRERQVVDLKSRLKRLAPDEDHGDEGTAEEAGTSEKSVAWYRSPMTLGVGGVLVAAALSVAWWSQQRRGASASSGG